MGETASMIPKGVRETRPMIPGKIVSGGQTGVDRGALEAAMSSERLAGGWCPAGRLAEDGAIPRRYSVVELDSADYEARTRQNIIDSDATLVLHRGVVSGGTRITVEYAEELGRPFLVMRLGSANGLGITAAWLSEIRPNVLNIAGPRESKVPGVQAESRRWLERLFVHLAK